MNIIDNKIKNVFENKTVLSNETFDKKTKKKNMIKLLKLLNKKKTQYEILIIYKMRNAHLK